MRLKNFHSGSFLTLQPTFATDPLKGDQKWPNQCDGDKRKRDN